MSLLSSLIAYYKLDEASGNATDIHGPNGLTENGTVASVAGKINTARDFSGAGTDFFDHVSNSDFQTGDVDFTFAHWVFLDATGISRKITGKGQTDPEYNTYFNDGAQRYRFEVYTGSGAAGQAFVELDDFLGTGAWHYIIAWHDSVANTINIQGNNGTVYSTAHSGGVFVGSENFFMGGFITGANPWNGRIDEMGFWKRILTSQERTDLYNGGAGLSYSSFGPPAGGLPFITRIGGKRV